MNCEKRNTFNMSLGAMLVGESYLPRDQAEECCRSAGGSLASLTTTDVVREVSEKIIEYLNFADEFFWIGVNINNNVGKWINGEDFECEFYELNVFMENLVQEIVNFHTFFSL